MKKKEFWTPSNFFVTAKKREKNKKKKKKRKKNPTTQISFGLPKKREFYTAKKKCIGATIRIGREI